METPDLHIARDALRDGGIQGALHVRVLEERPPREGGRNTSTADNGADGPDISSGGAPPAAAIRGYIRRAIRLNELGTKVQRQPSRPKRPLVVPADLSRALVRNREAREAFEGFSPSHRREYVEWITEAKQKATRLRRLVTALAWLAEGKPRNWKYMGKC